MVKGKTIDETQLPEEERIQILARRQYLNHRRNVTKQTHNTEVLTKVKSILLHIYGSTDNIPLVQLDMNMPKTKFDSAIVNYLINVVFNSIPTEEETLTKIERGENISLEESEEEDVPEKEDEKGTD